MTRIIQALKRLRSNSLRKRLQLLVEASQFPAGTNAKRNCILKAEFQEGKAQGYYDALNVITNVGPDSPTDSQAIAD